MRRRPGSRHAPDEPPSSARSRAPPRRRLRRRHGHGAHRAQAHARRLPEPRELLGGGEPHAPRRRRRTSTAASSPSAATRSRPTPSAPTRSCSPSSAWWSRPASSTASPPGSPARPCDEFETPERPRFVIGSMGPGTRLPSLGHTHLRRSSRGRYAEQARGLLEGGVDALLIETCQDILQSRRPSPARMPRSREAAAGCPSWCRSRWRRRARCWSARTSAAALAALDAYPHRRDRAQLRDRPAGDERARPLSRRARAAADQCHAQRRAAAGGQRRALLPAHARRACQLAASDSSSEDGVSIVGGCCGTTPEHIAAVASSGRAPRSRQASPVSASRSISSLYSATTHPAGQHVSHRRRAHQRQRLARSSRTSRAGRRGRHGRDGQGAGQERQPHDRRLHGLRRPRRGRRHDRRSSRASRPRCAVPLMIDSTEAPVIEAALKLAGGKCIVNSINLEDGEERCADVLPLCRSTARRSSRSPSTKRAWPRRRPTSSRRRAHLLDLATQKYGLRPDETPLRPAHLHHLHRQRGRPPARARDARRHPADQARAARVPHPARPLEHQLRAQAARRGTC